MLEKIARTLASECRLEGDQPLIVAVSGGPDSLCLLDILHSLGFSFIVAHVDHGLRSESAQDAEYVASLARARALSFLSSQVNVTAHAAARRASIEESARELRYRYLFEQAGLHGAQAVVTGHTADDQAETVLMHFLRGSGLPGLRGMAYRSLPNPWSRAIPLVRPLLGVWRSEIEGYLAQRGLMPIADSSNTDLRFYRNRLRHVLLPLLDGYNPGIRQRLWQMAQVVSGEHDLLEEFLTAAWQDCLREEGENWLAFDLDSLRAKPLAIQRRLFRRAASRLRPGLRDIDFASLVRACSFLDKIPQSGQADWIAGLRLSVEEGRFVIAEWGTPLPAWHSSLYPQFSQGEPAVLPIPGKFALADGWVVATTIIEVTPDLLNQAHNNSDPYVAWIDAQAVQAGLYVRTRLPGERIHPLGMQNHSLKVSDLMINKKIPAGARPGWPVIVCADQIVWIPGLHLADPYRLRSDSRSAVNSRVWRSTLD